VLLATDVIVVHERRVLLVVMVVAHAGRARVDLVGLERARSGLGRRGARLTVRRRRRDVRIRHRIVARVHGVRIIGRRLQRIRVGCQELRVLLRRRRGGLGISADRPEDLGFLAADFVVARAVGALQFEVLFYRVVEDPHAGPD
jgi:hypothetical protein